MKQSHWIVIHIFFLASSWVNAGDHLQLVTFKTHSRFILPIDEGVPVELKNSIQGFELNLKGISFQDLGAPLGDEDRWKSQLESLGDSRVKSIVLTEGSGGVVIHGKWNYPTGKLSLAYPSMEFFEYRETSPARYFADFWVKPGPTLMEVKATQKKSHLVAILKKAQEDEKRKLNRRIAREKSHQEVEDSLRFCEEPLNEKNNFFLEFYPAHQKVDFFRWFPTTSVDDDFHYFKPKKKTKDAQYVRLALDLYEQGKYALVLRTLAFFQDELPKSDFRIEMRFLRASALIKLGMNQEGEDILKNLMKDAAGTQVALRAATYLTGKLMARNLPLAALENFLWMIQHDPESSLTWVFHLGAAECLYSLRQTERASKEYQWVMDHAPDASNRAEAVARMGDLYLTRFQYDQAMGTFSQGLRYFKSEMKQFPSFYLNWGETLFQVGQHERSIEVFKEFLASYPNHSGGWRATLRLGEIYGKIGKTSAEIAQSRNWFYETVNRFPLSPGATLARLRLIPCMDHGGFTFESQEAFFSKEANDYQGSGEVFMKNYGDLRALTHVRTLIQLGSQDHTATAAIRELQTAKSPLLKKMLTRLASDYFRKMILGLLDQGKKYEALKAYNENSMLIPQIDSGTDADFLLKLSQASSDLGLGKFAEQLFDTYSRVVLSAPGRARSLASLPPSMPSSVPTSPSVPLPLEALDMETQLRTSEQNFTEAKALWVSLKSDEVEKYTKIRELLSAMTEESSYFYERELILGLMDHKEKKFESARSHVSRAQLLNQHPRIDSWLASLASELGEFEMALELYKNIEKRVRLKKNNSKNEGQTIEDVIGVPPLPDLRDLIYAQGEILEKQNRWGEAAINYSKAIEDGLVDEKIQYQYARSLMKDTQWDRAKEILEKLSKLETKTGSGIFWKKLAQQTLANERMNQSVTKPAKEGIHE